MQRKGLRKILWNRNQIWRGFCGLYKGYPAIVDDPTGILWNYFGKRSFKSPII